MNINRIIFFLSILPLSLSAQTNTFPGSGSVGIGTLSPGSKLHIADGGGGEQLRFSRGAGIVRFAQGYNSDDLFLYNRDASLNYMSWKSNGNVGIGTLNPDFKLTVNGKIKAEEIQVVVDVPADYVFKKDYRLQPLEEVEKFIDANGHLPGVPGAVQLKSEGWPVGEMNNKLLEKIEEITLYLIQLKKENDDLRTELEKIKNLLK